jgi:hypothetical protein
MQVSRRRFLRAAGVSLALPWLETFIPTLARGAAVAGPPRRMICICAPLGFYPGNFIPKETGKDYGLSPHLEVLSEYRDDFTVISGLPGISGGHQAIAGFLTGVPGAGQPGIRNAISVDQFAAEHIGGETRFSSLALSGEGLGLSWTRTGARVPAHNSPSRLFAEMFLEGQDSEVRAQLLNLEEGKSILDDVRDQAKSFRSNLGADDRDKLDEYLTSVRELEQRMVNDESWAKTPKPKVSVEPPKDIAHAADLIGRTRLLFDLTHLALQTERWRRERIGFSPDIGMDLLRDGLIVAVGKELQDGERLVVVHGCLLVEIDRTGTRRAAGIWRTHTVYVTSTERKCKRCRRP